MLSCVGDSCGITNAAVSLIGCDVRERLNLANLLLFRHTFCLSERICQKVIMFALDLIREFLVNQLCIG